MSEKMKRYTVTLDMYVYARNEKHAISKSKMIANRQRAQYDNQCEILEINEQAFGSMNSKPIYKK